MIRSTVLIAALATVALTPHAALAQEMPADMQGKGCTFYANPDGQGASARLNVRDFMSATGNQSTFILYAPTMAANWNDKLSAAVCDETPTINCYTVLYSDFNKGGQELVVLDGRAGFSSFAGTTYDDQASSLVVFCTKH